MRASEAGRTTTMNMSALLAASLVLAFTVAKSAATSAPAKSPAAPPGIIWSEGPEYPMGIQDSAVGVVDGCFVSAGGFSRHPKDVVKQYPDAFAGAKSGFTNLTFTLNLARPQSGWTRIPDLPGPARQAAASVVIRGALYAIGGFNYTAPFTYRSTYRLQQRDGAWVWTDLKCDTPWPVCEATAVAIGAKIYLFGAADYFGPAGKDQGENFYTEAGRDGSPVGRALLMLDPGNPAAGWKRLADFPGVPRSFCSTAAAGGKIYVFSGLFSPAKPAGGKGAEFYNVVDSWCYDPATDAWTRLADVPDNANARAVTVADRYIVLLGGYKYADTRHLDGTITAAQTPAERKLKMGDLIQKNVFVYDVTTKTFTPSAPMRDQSSWPLAAVDGRTIYCLGGEGGARMWHPATFQIGRVADDEPYSDWAEE